MIVLERHHPKFDQLWAQLLSSHINPTALLSQSCFDYRAHYLGASLVQQVQLLVVDKDQPIMGSRLELIRNASGQDALNAVDSPSALIVADSVGPAQQAGAHTLLRKRLDQIIGELNVQRLRFVDPLIDGSLSFLSHWALSEGATIENQFKQVIDLTKDEAALWNDLTKSCRWGVNWGRKNLALTVSTKRDALQALRELHLKASGRVTRPDATWEIQAAMLERDEAFVVTAQMEGETLSAALFTTSSADCDYSVAASDRRLFDKPLGHAVIWEAVLHARRLGCRRFALGNQVWQTFHWHLPAPSAKEANIARFKRSFGGNTVPEFIVDLKPGAVASSARGGDVRPSSPHLASTVPEALKNPALSQGSVVSLRPLTEDDITDRYLGWFSNEVVNRYLEVRTVSGKEAADYIRHGLATNEYFMCAVCDRQSGLHIGNLKIGPIRWRHGTSDLVTVIGDQDYWGKGVATEAIRMAMRIAFQVLGIRKLTASILDGNTGSLRAYTRAGWHVEARLLNDTVVDNRPADRLLISAFNPG